MKCRLCEEYFNTDNSFSFLFHFPEICPTCKIKYKATINHEIIPIDRGEIHYIYLYDLPLNLVQRNYLDRFLFLIFDYLKKEQNKCEIMIFIDDLVLKEMAKCWPLLKPFNKIMFCSLRYLDIINWNFLE